MKAVGVTTSFASEDAMPVVDRVERETGSREENSMLKME